MPSLEAFLVLEDKDFPPPEGRHLIGEAFFRALDTNRPVFRSDPILPSLKKLCLAITTPFNEEAILTMIRSRWWPVSRSVVLHTSEAQGRGQDRNSGKNCASLDSFQFGSLKHTFCQASETIDNFKKLQRSGFRLHIQDPNGTHVSF
jgi:hypothetical protein